LADTLISRSPHRRWEYFITGGFTSSTSVSLELSTGIPATYWSRMFFCLYTFHCQYRLSFTEFALRFLFYHVRYGKWVPLVHCFSVQGLCFEWEAP
jgi:hypothetical protein